MSTSERPGVYTSYEVSGSIYGGNTGSAVGLVANDESGELNTVKILTSIAQVRENYGGGALTKLAEILFRNGAPKIYAVRCDDEGYYAAYESLMEYEDIRFMVHDYRDLAAHLNLSDAIAAAPERGKYRIGIVEVGCEYAEEFVEVAAEFNSERIVLVSNWENLGVPGSTAAALCGVMASQDDPALPLNGVQLKGLADMVCKFTDSEITQMINGGVTPIELVGGVPTVVRGITTRTKTADTEDYTWRDVNTVMILDEVIPTIRDGLKVKFSRTKNTAQTRGAIRTFVLVELENYLRSEVIDSYGDITVTQSESDPGTCLVSFSFAVAHGLNKIELHANITV